MDNNIIDRKAMAVEKAVMAQTSDARFFYYGVSAVLGLLKHVKLGSEESFLDDLKGLILYDPKSSKHG